MSDCFDHELDAWEQHAQYCNDVDCDYGDIYYDGFEYNPLFHHNYYNDIEIISETKNAYLIVFNDMDKCWVPKKLCKNETEHSIYIWEGIKLKPIIEMNVESIED